jgi:hypothetical protein
MKSIKEEQPEQNEIILAALTFTEETKSISEGIDMSEIAEWLRGISHAVFIRNEVGLFIVGPVQWKPEYQGLVTHWMPYPEHPLLKKEKEHG